MSVQRQGRSATASTPIAASSSATLAAPFLAITAPTITVLLVIGTPLILPSLSVISLASAGLVALAALWTAPNRECAHITLWDVSGAYAFVGFAAGMLSEPEHVMQFVALPANVHEAVR